MRWEFALSTRALHSERTLVIMSSTYRANLVGRSSSSVQTSPAAFRRARWRDMRIYIAFRTELNHNVHKCMTLSVRLSSMAIAVPPRSNSRRLFGVFPKRWRTSLTLSRAIFRSTRLGARPQLHFFCVPSLNAMRFYYVCLRRRSSFCEI